MTTSKTEISTGTDINSERADREQQLVLSPTPGVTQQLCWALKEFPGQSGALGCTWTTREEAERHAAQFCEAARVEDVGSPSGEYYARVFELTAEQWGVVVWYA